jgi:hypothetical protein
VNLLAAKTDVFSGRWAFPIGTAKFSVARRRYFAPLLCRVLLIGEAHLGTRLDRQRIRLRSVDLNRFVEGGRSHTLSCSRWIELAELHEGAPIAAADERMSPAALQTDHCSTIAN